MATALPRAALLLVLPLLLASAARSQDQEEPYSPVSEPAASPLPRDYSVADTDAALPPISQPPTSSAPAAADAAPAPAPADDKEADDGEKDNTHSAAPAPAPAADDKEADGEKDKDDDDHKSSAPAPAPAAEEIKAASGDGDGEGHEEMNGGKKAGVVVGAFTASAVVGLGCFVWRKRRANIRRARYAEYDAARLELV